MSMSDDFDNPRKTSTLAPDFSSGQGVASGATGELVPACTVKRTVTLINHGATDIFVGPAGVTPTSGALLQGLKGATLKIETRKAVHGVTSGNAQAFSYLETA